MRTLILNLIGAATLCAAAADVRITLNGELAKTGDYKPAGVPALKLDNGIVSIRFGPDGTATSVTKNGTELAHNLNGIAARDPDSRFYIEHHTLMMKGESGLYGYVICKNIENQRLGGEMRSMCRWDRDILDWAYVSERTGQQPRYADLVKLPSVQDETWRMPDGEIYRKYDYSGYIAENPVWGHYSHGFAAWLVHQDALILNYFQGAHDGGGGPGSFKNNEKLFGPWFVYLNEAALEQSRWPYKWMDDPLYPVNRTSVTGLLACPACQVVLAKPAEEIYKQAGVIYYSKTDTKGKFTIPSVRPGTYALYAYATHGSNTDQFEKDGIEVGGPALDLGTRMVPADLTYTIGKSNERDDWYFAPGKRGNWDLKFNVDRAYAGSAHLTVAIAGVSQNPSVPISVNGTYVKSLSYGNDAATYRAALRSARYQTEEIEFPASLLHAGENAVRFAMTAVGGNGRVMYDTIKLEVD